MKAIITDAVSMLII